VQAAPGSILEVGYNKDLLAAEGVIANNGIMKALLGFGGMFILIIVAASILVISNSFRISADDRTRQFGVLKSVGGTRNQILQSVVMEGGILSCIGIPIGIAAGLLMEWIALGIAGKLLPDTMALKMIISPAPLCISAVLSVATILLSAYFPVQKGIQNKPAGCHPHDRCNQN
jgi:ABC-type antimicrobial peptide transport system, permease component